MKRKVDAVEARKIKWIVRSSLVKGLIEKKPCEKCGEKKSEAHHEDYNKPLDIVWLCKRCHKQRHQQIRRETENPLNNKKSTINGRTRKGQEELILIQIRQHGGFSIFWVTENQRRASAACRLEDAGKIKRLPDTYPWCKYEIVE